MYELFNQLNIPLEVYRKASSRFFGNLFEKFQPFEANTNIGTGMVYYKCYSDEYGFLTAVGAEIIQMTINSDFIKMIEKNNKYKFISQDRNLIKNVDTSRNSRKKTKV